MSSHTPSRGASVQSTKQTEGLELYCPEKQADLGSTRVRRGEENLPEETVPGLTLQHAEVSIQCFHFTCDNGTELAVRGIRRKKMQLLYYSGNLYLRASALQTKAYWLGDILPLVIMTFS